MEADCPIADPIQDEFPDIRCIDWQGGHGREAFQRDEATQVYWSQDLTLERGGGNPTYLPTCVSQASYLINLTNLKGHSLAGITLGAKNHFGSISADRHGSPTSSPTSLSTILPSATPTGSPSSALWAATTL